jgi:hypothetical protein
MICRCAGVDFKVKVMDVAGPDGKPKRVKVTIWDTGVNNSLFCIMYIYSNISIFLLQLVRKDFVL